MIVVGNGLRIKSLVPHRLYAMSPLSYSFSIFSDLLYGETRA